MFRGGMARPINFNRCLKEARSESAFYKNEFLFSKVAFIRDGCLLFFSVTVTLHYPLTHTILFHTLYLMEFLTPHILSALFYFSYFSTFCNSFARRIEDACKKCIFLTVSTLKYPQQSNKPITIGK